MLSVLQNIDKITAHSTFRFKYQYETVLLLQRYQVKKANNLYIYSKYLSQNQRHFIKKKKKNYGFYKI